MSNKIKQLILLFGDIIVLYLSLYLTLLLRYFSQPSAEIWNLHFIPFSLTFVGWIFIFYLSRLYNLHYAVNKQHFWASTIKSVLIAGLISTMFFYLTPSIGITPKTNMAIFLVIFVIIFLNWRSFVSVMLNKYLPQEKVLAIGWNKQLEELCLTLSEKPYLGFQIAAICDNQTHTGNGMIKYISDMQNIIPIIKSEKISTILLTNGSTQTEELRAILFQSLRLGVNMVNFPKFYENITGKVPIEAITHAWFLENLSEGSKRRFETFKHAMDSVSAIIMLILTAPFWPIIAMIIKLESHGPVFFTQIRAGKNGRPFSLLKFRSMREENNDGTLTVQNDARITRFGKFMRKTRVDELPQVLNIILGDLSLVGPRPEQPKLIETLKKQIPFYEERMLVRPGITGWDQISGEYHSPTPEDTLKKLQYDLYYIKNRSIYLDLSIILKTITTVFSSQGR